MTLINLSSINQAANYKDFPKAGKNLEDVEEHQLDIGI